MFFANKVHDLSNRCNSQLEIGKWGTANDARLFDREPIVTLVCCIGERDRIFRCPISRAKHQWEIPNGTITIALHSHEMEVAIDLERYRLGKNRRINSQPEDKSGADSYGGRSHVVIWHDTPRAPVITRSGSDTWRNELRSTTLIIPSRFDFILISPSWRCENKNILSISNIFMINNYVE